MGRAFITHYQMPGRDPQAAIPQYEALLQDVDERDLWRGQILGRLADCYMEVVPAQVDKARSLCDQALSALPDDSPLVQETMLRLLSCICSDPTARKLRSVCSPQLKWHRACQRLSRPFFTACAQRWRSLTATTAPSLMR